MSLRRSTKNSASPAAMGFLPPDSPAALAAGEAEQTAALQRLEAAMRELRNVATEPVLRRALDELRAENHHAATEWALKALKLDEMNATAWRILAAARDSAGDFKTALQAYDSALALTPNDFELANDLGRLAYRMGKPQIAEQLFRRHLEHDPASVEATNNLACVIRDGQRHAEAIEILRPAIVANPQNAMLWNTLGTVLNQQGDTGTSLTFYDEAIRLDPTYAKALHNRSNALLSVGRADEAFADCEAAYAASIELDDKAMMRLSRSSIELCRGQIAAGWDDYEVRFDPHFAAVTRHLVRYPRWSPETALEGKTLLVFGEQGLGDEVLFANLLPDLIEALGPGGKLVMAVERRLVPLIQRSFPMAEVGAHATYKVDGHVVRGAEFTEDREDIDLWSPIGSLLRRFRRTLEDFPDRKRFLTADPARVDHWRRVLATAPTGPKVGILWKSLKLDAERARYFSPFQLWGPVLRTRGISFVNIQYGDCAEELAMAERDFGVTIWQPPGIDLKEDLDDLAALTCALDLNLGFANATSNIAAACGAPTWIISPPGAWTRLGTDRMPWYPQARVFLQRDFANYDSLLGEVAFALATTFG
ncbi:MAG: tetratricopeptide repeat protein [Caulobacterales bacterium]